MTTVADLRKWLEQFEGDDAVNGYEGEDTGVVVTTDHHVRFLHAHKDDDDVLRKRKRMFAFERSEMRRKSEERRYWGD
jgi:hypothetical protein